MMLHHVPLLAAALSVLGSASAQQFSPKPAFIDAALTPKGSVGHTIPPVGFGTWVLPNSTLGADAVARAIKVGFRHFDGAAAYQNQWAVGAGIAKGLRENPDVKRENLWVTMKLWSTRHKDPAQGLVADLKVLGLEYLDLILIHFPVGQTPLPGQNATAEAVAKGLVKMKSEYDFVEMWGKMEKLLEPDAQGIRRVRHIGISNFNTTQIDELLASAKVKPFMHQIERHPYLPDPDFYAFHKAKNISLTAYAPLGNRNPQYHYRNWKSAGRLLLDDPVLKDIAVSRNCTSSAQVSLAWNLAAGVNVIPKAERLEHAIENYEARTKCKLQPEDITAINALTTGKRSPKRYWDMFCQIGLPGYLGLQDAPKTLPAPADFCDDPGKPAAVAYEKDPGLWQKTQTCNLPF